MAGMHAEIEINRPIEDVYGFFLDLERNIVATDPTVESVIKITGGPAGPGTTYRLRQPVLGKIREQTMRVTAIDPNRRIDMEASFGPVRPRFSLAFERTSSGTRVTYRGDSRPVGPFKLVPFLMDRIGQRNWNRRLGLMKVVLEANDPPAAKLRDQAD
jgi:Polyketide cyclase / dehydrase and lipid transport